MVSMVEPLNVFFRAARMKKRRGLSRWISEELILPDGPYKGTLYQIDRFAWVAPVLAEMEWSKHDVLEAVPRLGKSTIGIAKYCWRIFEYGDSGHCTAQDEKTSKSFHTGKIEPIIIENERLKQLLPAGYTPRDKARTEIYLNNGGIMRNYFNPKSVRSYDASVYLATEAGSYKLGTENEADIVTLALRRQDRHDDGGYSIIESTATHDKSILEREKKKGTMSLLMIDCPECGGEISSGSRECVKGWQEAESLEDVLGAFVCPHCEHAITEEERQQLKPWVKHRNPAAKERKRFSVTINWWWADHTIQHVAELEWEHKNNPDTNSLRNLYQNIYAEAINQEKEAKELRKEHAAARFGREHLLDRRVKTFKKGAIPPNMNPEYITAAIDVQKKWGYYIVLGYNDETNAVYPIDWEVIYIVPLEMQQVMDATPDMVLDALQETYQMLRKRYRPKTIWVDINYKHPSSERAIIEEWTLNKAEIRPVRGKAGTESDKLKSGQVILPPQAAQLAKVYQSDIYGEDVWFLNVDAIKEDLNSRIMYPLKTCGIWFPSEILSDKGKPDFLVRHMLTEQRQVIRDRFGNQKVHWINKDNKRNDLFDCMVYAYFGLLLMIAVLQEKQRRQKKKEEKAAKKALPQTPQVKQPTPQPPAGKPPAPAQSKVAPQSTAKQKQPGQHRIIHRSQQRTGYRF